MLSVEEQRPGGPIPLPRYIPDDLTITQFLLDSDHSYRPQRPFGTPWFIDDESGMKIGAEEVTLSFVPTSEMTDSNSLDPLGSVL